MSVTVQIEKPKLKPIEFVKVVYEDRITNCISASKWDNIELLGKGSLSKGRLDTMFAYDNDALGNPHRSSGLVYFGHWNDGII